MSAATRGGATSSTEWPASSSFVANREPYEAPRIRIEGMLSDVRQPQQPFQVPKEPARGARRRITHHQIAVRVHDVDAGRAVDRRRELREEPGAAGRRCREHEEVCVARVELDVGALARMQEDAPYPRRILVERRAHARELVE